jgi:hypothetical protein
MLKVEVQSNLQMIKFQTYPATDMDHHFITKLLNYAAQILILVSLQFKR